MSATATEGVNAFRLSKISESKGSRASIVSVLPPYHAFIPFGVPNKRIHIRSFVLRRCAKEYSRLVVFDHSICYVKFSLRWETLVQIIKRSLYEVEAVHVDLVVDGIPKHASASFTHIDLA